MIEPSCHTCVYAWYDAGQWMANLTGFFGTRPICANHPDAPGRTRPTSPGACRNYRPRPGEPDMIDGSVRRIPVTGGLYAYVDAADYEWLSKYRWCLAGGKYAGRWEKGKVIFMHREIMQTPPGEVTDHWNGNGMDNTRVNLRNCSRRDNMRNRAKRLTNGQCKYKGVFRDNRRNKIFAKITVNAKPIWLGYHDTEEAAARAYDRAALQYFREFAHVNFPDEWPPERREALYADLAAHPPKPPRKNRKRKPRDSPNPQSAIPNPKSPPSPDSRKTRLNSPDEAAGE